MESLIIKPVPFLGSELLAIQDENGEIHAAINPILRGLGFDEKQIEYHRFKWLDDRVIAKGTQKFSETLLGAGTGRDTWTITLKKLPFALAKISITPTMEREIPALTDTLEKYQDKCADVLAEAFLPETRPELPSVVGLTGLGNIMDETRTAMVGQRSHPSKIAKQMMLFLEAYHLPVIEYFV